MPAAELCDEDSEVQASAVSERVQIRDASANIDLDILLYLSIVRFITSYVLILATSNFSLQQLMKH